MNQETKDAIEELKQDASDNDVLLRKAVKVIKKAETKGIDKQEVIQFLQAQGFTMNDIDGAFSAKRKIKIYSHLVSSKNPLIIDIYLMDIRWFS